MICRIGPFKLMGSAIGVALLALTVSTRAQVAAPAAALPDARQVFARHVAALGGEAAFKKVRSMSAKGRFAVAAQGLAGDVELFSARPGRLRFRVTIPGIGRIENGYDGAIGWSLSSLSGPEVLSGRQLTEQRDDAWFDGPLHGADYVRTAEVVGRVEFDGQPAYKLRVVLVSGSEATEYFSVASGLQIGTEASRATPAGIVPTVNILREYKTFGALTLATSIVQRALGFEQVITLTSCEFDTVPDEVFVPPAEIRALARP